MRFVHPRRWRDFRISSRQLFSTDNKRSLRILFCGSDAFSASSLARLSEEQKSNQKLITSIDVVCKAGQGYGRGRKLFRDVPVKRVALDAGLAVHEISTFTGWQPPTKDDRPIDLIITASFGLLVPRRILNLTTYGGLNVHPSLLPALRGPAPLHHTILRDLTSSGVTIQALHPSIFDEGSILMRSRCSLDAGSKANIGTLQLYMAPLAAELLVQGLRARVFERPYPQLQCLPYARSHAPQLRSEDAHVDWTSWTGKRVILTQQALGSVWSLWSSKHHGKLRVQWHELEDWTSLLDRCTLQRNDFLPGIPSLLQLPSGTAHGRTIGGIWSADGRFLCPRAITVEGRARESPANCVDAIRKLMRLNGTDGQNEMMSILH